MDVRIFLLVFLLHLVQSKVLDLSCKQIRAFVDGHNSRRLSLAKGSIPNQPAASEMKYIIWDKELAGKAAKWASTNQFNHNPDRTIGHSAADERQRLRHVRVHVRGVQQPRRALLVLAGAHALPAPQGRARAAAGAPAALSARADPTHRNIRDRNIRKRLVEKFL